MYRFQFEFLCPNINMSQLFPFHVKRGASVMSYLHLHWSDFSGNALFCIYKGSMLTRHDLDAIHGLLRDFKVDPTIHRFVPFGGKTLTSMNQFNQTDCSIHGATEHKLIYY